MVNFRITVFCSYFAFYQTASKNAIFIKNLAIFSKIPQNDAKFENDHFYEYGPIGAEFSPKIAIFKKTNREYLTKKSIPQHFVKIDVFEKKLA